MIKSTDRNFLKELFDCAVMAANPEHLMEQFLPKKPKGRTIVVGAGKGSAQMALALEKLWAKAGYGKLEGAVVTCYGCRVELRSIEVLEASHPLPDENGLKAAKKLVKLVQGLSPDDLVIALICGGGSALLPLPLEPLSLEDEIAINEALLKSGAPIGAMNTIRKHLSQIKGGRLAYYAAPARVVSFIVSDIPGDIASQVASGPTIADWSTREDALKFVSQYHIALPQKAVEVLNSELAKAPTPDNTAFEKNAAYIVASAATSLEAASAHARKRGWNAVILSDSIEGEARDIALMHAAIAREIALKNRPFEKPVVLLSGGETSVTIGGEHGKGGRNSEFLLSFSIAIEGESSITALAADTDGRDGSEDNAGAFCDGNSCSRLKQQGLDPATFLVRHDAWTAFDILDDLLVTGPTGTNVNDFRAILIR
ncbi:MULTISPECIES: glycerate kinase [Bartonella]|uniref:glycerate kinase type-2 family protein n=1 Tax=Bartonella TaxID=773 RepID=UPI0018DE08D9|nr:MULTISPECIES: glycerate kinase [Bartonella]MBH9995728.1 glycerate kinase [Bartonella sp. P0291]MBH9995928.1 glycerate kinase [Bartonella sp. M0192]MBH9998088.1 glycerate kinase [Bartonella sp. M0191]MBI0009016.1 glycerate kinase [Bartonella sp. M0193]MBI0009379.1 glycerate kinase [Bartonella sp. M0176]